jgi:TonB-dependent SusC/RagA subfamily outer membrane receptor
MKKKIFLILLVSFFAQLTTAQEKVVHGIIHTLDSIPLIGVEIKSRSANQSFYTDSLGRFSVITEPGDKLKVRAEGFYNENLKVDEKTKFIAINLKMKPGEKQREYAIGYGYVSEKDLTSAVNQFTLDENDFTRYNNMSELLTGRFPGVEIRNGEIFIRGTKTFHGSEAALIVLDGVISEPDILNSLSPIDVKSVNVIKDGSSAVYGSRGANGVVIIETKKGGDL